MEQGLPPTCVAAGPAANRSALFGAEGPFCHFVRAGGTLCKKILINPMAEQCWPMASDGGCNASHGNSAQTRRTHSSVQRRLGVHKGGRTYTSASPLASKVWQRGPPVGRIMRVVD